MHKVLVIGGYGFFGKRICMELLHNKSIHLLIGGRDLKKAQAVVKELNLAMTQAICLDIHAKTFDELISALKVDTIIHTAGPFQTQDYRVALAAIRSGANYIDLADGRDFVCSISKLNELAVKNKVLVTSGASSLPALSSAVVDKYLPRFQNLDSIEYGISSGARSPGIATVRGIFSYCGKHFNRLKLGEIQSVRGWLDTRLIKFPKPLKWRLLGACDVPDLDLFPKRYSTVRTVTFHAGFASHIGHLVVWLGAQLVRCGVIKNLLFMAPILHNISRFLEPVISDKGGMFVRLKGIGENNQFQELTWYLVASNNHGPHIPCGAAIALTNKLANQETKLIGAMPCLGLLTLEEYLSTLKSFSVQEFPA